MKRFANARQIMYDKIVLNKLFIKKVIVALIVAA